MSPKKYLLKLVLIGDGGVGKTSLIQVYTKKGFAHDYKITIGLSVEAKDLTLPDGSECTFSIHDIAGQPRFEAIRNSFYNGTHIAMLVFDLTRESSLTNLESNWLPNLLKVNPNLEGKYMLVVANKSDLEDFRMIEDEGKAFAKKLNACAYIETSALKNENVEEAFVKLAQSYVDNNS